MSERSLAAPPLPFPARVPTGTERPPGPGSSLTLHIDGRPVQMAVGATLLQAARQARVELPTLCHRDGLEPSGACRLCVVEVRWAPEEPGRVVAACLYPVREGLTVLTQTPVVRQARRVALQLLRARCPDTPALEAIAAELDLPDSALRPRADADSCVLCGLCTRVCEAFATGAITTLHRGVSKAVGFALHHNAAEDCVGCLACAAVCPTGHIQPAVDAETVRIWGRQFDKQICTVDATRCRGCGGCEQACPFAVARVVRFRNGGLVARIDGLVCRGCGLCLPACPSGAIDQRGSEDELLLQRLWDAGPAPAGRHEDEP